MSLNDAVKCPIPSLFSSLHIGCCPDNISPSEGPDNKGCGCEFTEFGKNHPERVTIPQTQLPRLLPG